MTANRRGIATRQRVLDQALPVFGSLGPAARIEDIGLASGVSVGSLYHHFGSRDGIIAALYSRCLHDLVAHVADSVTACGTAHDGVREFVRSYLSWIDGHPDEATLIFTITHYGIAASELRADKDEPMARLASWYAAQARAGEVKPLAPAVVELFLVGPLSEYCRRRMHGALPDDPQFAAQVAESLTVTAWDGLRA